MSGDKVFYLLGAVLLMSLATILTRFLPYWVFRRRKAPQLMLRLQGALPAAILGILIFQGLLGSWQQKGGLDLLFQSLALGLTLVLHLWKKEFLLSLLGGTALYMVLIRLF